ncbi:unnamed protein product [Caenorhabditis sp. 36 PRJEB53466]|nr:unnamed protein product [Caenorhabditis sp. 36 PRJEB53466]
MDFIDNQAEESDDSSGRSDIDEPQLKKRKTEKEKSKQKRKVVASSDEDEDDDDDEEEGREEMKGFIADEDEEEDAKSEKSEKSRHSGEDELDDEDIDLINENLDINNGRRAPRVQLGDSSDEDEPIKRVDRDDDLRSERGGSDDERGPRRDHRGYGSESDRSEDDFIEDDGDGPRRHRKRHRGDENVPEGAEDDARDVFGVEDFNFDEFYDDEDGEDGLEDEEEEIVEDDGEGGEIKIRRKKDTTKKSTLLEAIEPSELERGFLSAGDKKIMIEDAPERFQLRRTPVTEADDEELEREAQWIMKYAFEEPTVTNQSSTDEYDRLVCILHLDSNQYEAKKKQVLGAIKEVLKFMRIRSNSFEVPFIGFYRKEFIDNMLNINHLWKVYDFDERWCHLAGKKQKLYDLMRRMRDYQEQSDDITAKRRPISEMDLIDINFTETLEQLTDIHANFQLLYGSLLESMQRWEKEQKETNGEEEEEFKVKFKSSIRNDKYQMCVENGIGELAGRFGLTAKQFSENLDWKKHDIEQDPMLPLDAAEEYICPSYPDKETVLQGAKYMLAKEISRQPLVRDRVRRDFRTFGRFWVRPTKKGRETIDENHPLYDKRYIKNKPIRCLTDEEFLYYHTAKADGLIDLVIHAESDEDQQKDLYLVNKYLSDSIFRRDEYSENVEQWNTVRDDCVKMAITEMLVPYMADEIYNTLLEEAKISVAKKCRKEFASRIARGGFRMDDMIRDEDDDDEMDRHGAMRIMAIVYPTERDEATFGAMVDENGSMVDYVRMVHFTKRGGGHTNNANLKAESMELFKKFVQRRRPHAIALNIEDMECSKLKQDLNRAIMELMEKNMIPKEIPVLFVDNEAAKVYMRSNMSVAENPDHPPVLRQAVSLARLLLDPVPEYAHLWNSDEDIFCLSLHPLQREIEQEMLANFLSHELINKVNEQGVDINKCVEFPHYTNMLQFTCGLGPRKATALLKSIKANDNLIESRSKLVTGCKLGPKVFMNCAGFIRIDTHKVSEKTDAYVEVLDGSRVHPETYEWARKMAVDALEVDDSADPTAALQEIMESPDRLRDLDLDAFAEELTRQGFGEKKATLYDISSELSARYKDLRELYREPTGEVLYDMLARSGKEIKVGMKVLGTVQQVQYRKVDRENHDAPLPEVGDDGQFTCPFCKSFTTNSPGGVQEHIMSDPRRSGCPGTPVGIRVRFDNGFTGFCPNKNISSSKIDNPLTRVKLNHPYYFKVLQIEKERFNLLLSCKSTDLKAEDTTARDEYWDQQLYEDDLALIKSEVKKKKEANTRVKRVIAHPNFDNCSYEMATKKLDEKDWTECIIRPSANNDSSLSVTWKICDGVYHNFFVKESAKDQVFSIGRQLSVGGEDFEDLDELIARFVQPMIQISHEITTHKYFFTGGTCEKTEAVEEFVREKRRELGRFPYVFSASLRSPCQFCLSYMFDNTDRIRHEYFKVSPHGIRFRHQNFDTLDRMLGWFKRHFHEPPADFRRSTAPPNLMKKTSSNNSISSAPKRPQKQGDVQNIVKNEPLFQSSKKCQENQDIIILSDDDDVAAPIATEKIMETCKSCRKDISGFTKDRRAIHTKVCSNKAEERREKKKLTETLERDDEVMDKKFVEPKKVLKNWEVAKNNVKFARIPEDDEDNRRRKRPRSFAVVELQPKKCRCEVIDVLHSRFCDNFHAKSIQNSDKKQEGITEYAHYIRAIIDKNSRYEQLSLDLQKVFDDESEPPSNVTIKCTDGEVLCLKVILKHRTTIFKNYKNAKATIIEIGKSLKVVQGWLSYVFSARIEWEEDLGEEVCDLAKQWGPMGLEHVIGGFRRKWVAENELEEKGKAKIPGAASADVQDPNSLQTEPEKYSEEQKEPEPEPEEPVDVFMSDDPFIGFGRAEKTEDEEKEEIPKEETPQVHSEEMDSFETWGEQIVVGANNLPTTSTPTQKFVKPVFGSNIKILKTNDVTPMPNYEKMDEAELKERMIELGLKPKGKKVMIQTLRNAYNALHPEVCSDTPTLRPLIRIQEQDMDIKKKNKKTTKIKTLSERMGSPKKLAKVTEEDEEKQEEVDEGEADKTLNMSNDYDQGRICGDDVEDDDEEEEVTSTQTMKSGKNDPNVIRNAFLEWLRSENNSVLHNHILSLQPVSLEEMMLRLEKAEGPLGRLGKAKLVKVLDSLRITYQLPQKGGPRKIGGGFKRKF